MTWKPGLFLLFFGSAAQLGTSDKTGHFWWGVGSTLLCPQVRRDGDFLRKCLRTLERAAAGFKLKKVVASGAS